MFVVVKIYTSYYIKIAYNGLNDVNIYYSNLAYF